MSQCEWVERHLSAYHDGVLDTATTQQVKEHLATCANCAAILADYQRNDAALKRMPRYAPADTLKARIFASPEFQGILSGQPNQTVTLPPAGTKRPTTPHIARLITQAAAVLVILAGAGLLLNHIFAQTPRGPLYAACPSDLPSGSRLVYLSGGQLLSNGAPLVCDPHAKVGAFRASPDGQWIAYTNTTRGEVRVVRADATDDHPVATGAGELGQLSWSPDSQTLLIVKQRDLQTVDIYRAGPHDVKATLYATFAAHSVQGPITWSPDGAYFAFAEQPATAQRAALHVFALASSQGNELPLNESVRPQWYTGANGPRLTWSTIAPNPTPDVTLTISDCATDLTCQQTTIANATTSVHTPNSSHWTVNTSNGAFLDVDAATGQQTTLPVNEVVTGLLWSPDSKHLAVIHNGALEVITGATVTTIAQDVAHGSTPTTFGWTPDSASIFFGGATGAQAVNLTTGAVSTLIPTSAGHITGLGWSPDGQTFVYWGEQGMTITPLTGRTPIHVTAIPDNVSAFPQWTVAP